ncbi:hypothetical protein AB6D66_01485 [Vibrio pomeroyi]|uniref:Uncharacterized protein n=1 Tax=Vibrio pomeroyi TaxID=198832 RepID=A0ABV4MRE4_9VIBR|nr:hypothetical protein [Vibrio atlanticus]MCZ4310203.1 hypothetical protein [Vibrio atlanticus]
MNVNTANSTILFGEYPVDSAKLKTAKTISTSTLSSTLLVSLVLAAKSLVMAPPEVLNVSASPSYCPGSLKVAVKEEHDYILSCSNSIGGSIETPSIVISDLSKVIDDAYKIVAVLEDEKEEDPKVVATLPGLSDSDVVKDFVQNALNKSDTHIGESASYYWGIGDAQNANLGLIDSLLDSGVTNPSTLIDDTIMTDLASSYKTKERISKIVSTPDSDKGTVDIKPKKPTSVEDPFTKKGRSCDKASRMDELTCKQMQVIKDITDGPLSKIMMILMILMAILNAVVRPNLVGFAGAVASVLVLANISKILEGFLG